MKAEARIKIQRIKMSHGTFVEKHCVKAKAFKLADFAYDNLQRAHFGNCIFFVSSLACLTIVV